MNFAERLIDQADGDTIEAVRLSNNVTWGSNNKPIPAEIDGKVITWEQAKPYLQGPISALIDIVAWTPRWVLFSEYGDCWADIRALPRHPRADN